MRLESEDLIEILKVVTSKKMVVNVTIGFEEAPANGSSNGDSYITADSSSNVSIGGTNELDSGNSNGL